MSKLFAGAQNLGKSFMLPIAVLPAAGLLLGIGGVFSNPVIVATYSVLDNAALQAIFTLMKLCGSVVFDNLSLLFAVGISVGLARSDKGTAGLAAVLCFIVMNKAINAMLTLTGTLAVDNLASVGQGSVLGIVTLQTGVMGGIVSGLLTAWLHNRYSKTELPSLLAFFSGSRFVPIVTSFFAIFLGVALFWVWPPIQTGITHLGGLVEKTGYIGTFIYGMILKCLIPLGLHHLFYLPFWMTSVGGEVMVNGHLVQGTQKIFFAQLADPSVTQYYIGVSRFMAGRFADFMFGLPGAALAIYHSAKPENRKKVAGLLLSAALTAFVTGITEPLEFAFMFCAPLLYGVHVVLTGVAFMLTHMLAITVGQTFSGGLIDFLLFGVLQGNAKTNWVLMLPLGAVMFCLYYVSFRFLIHWRQLKTPGREDDSAQQAQPVQGKAHPAEIVLALGGRENIIDVDCCATRLRVTVKEPAQVKLDAFKHLGSRGAFLRGEGVQVVYGPHVTLIKNEVEEFLGS
ncbi:PTS transporter subunit EIIC [Cronobacter sakazakii]|uniref:PTS transporter subunit EIIC n=1 Tax=Cronobacter sakazakii TaxID=28141 RepID=UPI0011E47156|nr:PTS transporter subunit EIIC [Cronobacter sakazakii]MDT3611540.1 PTS transporter subunit EIIC [Cronobacter sakazakii]QWR80514.1 PTS transporter subunit EIIC [Cronobacter sakazakii]TYD50770.1 PTS glucose transporter subunit IIB [Cronobacter sakazakii]